jgi:hypothetical protein
VEVRIESEKCYELKSLVGKGETEFLRVSKGLGEENRITELAKDKAIKHLI